MKSNMKVISKKIDYLMAHLELFTYLELDSSPTPQEVKKAWKQKLLEIHPDKGGLEVKVSCFFIKVSDTDAASVSDELKNFSMFSGIPNIKNI